MENIFADELTSEMLLWLVIKMYTRGHCAPKEFHHKSRDLKTITLKLLWSFNIVYYDNNIKFYIIISLRSLRDSMCPKNKITRF